MKNSVTLLIENRILFISLTILLLCGCGKDENMMDVSSCNTPNILLIIADDIGKDALNGFSEGSIKPITPHIDSIRTSGLSFTNFWSYPTCSPTRASILTGKYGYRTGVKWASDVLDLSETSLQEYINQGSNNAYSTAIIGKWHLSGNSSTFNPEVFGIDHYSGLIRGQAQSYYNWLLTEDGAGSLQSDYATEKFTNLALEWIGEQDDNWFMWLAYNAPHTPFHAPPVEMHSQGDLPTFANGMDEIPYYLAAIEAMDFQIGRLLDGIPEAEKENMVIIFIADNGTPNEVAQLPYSGNTAKGTLHQGGINVPMFISGRDVTRIENDHSLVTSTDLFATISEIAGVPTSEIHDSKSIKSLFTQSGTIRNYQYAEKDDGNVNNWAISDGTYKLIEYVDGNTEFYDLENDPYEQNALLDNELNALESVAKQDLQAELLNIRQ